MFWMILGLISGIICLISFFPQIIKGYKTKKLDDISYYFMIILGFGMFLWVLYGNHIGSFPIAFTNSIGICCNVILIKMKFTYSKINKSTK